MLHVSLGPGRPVPLHRAVQPLGTTISLHAPRAAHAPLVLLLFQCREPPINDKDSRVEIVRSSSQSESLPPSPSTNYLAPQQLRENVLRDGDGDSLLSPC